MSDNATPDEQAEELGQTIVEACEQTIEDWVNGDNPVRRVDDQILADEEWLAENLAIMVALTADEFNQTG